MIRPRPEGDPPIRHQRLILAAVVVMALGLRLWWGVPIGQPVPLVDPDNYTTMARALADGQHPWHWSFEAVRYWEFHKAPLYQVFLSLFTVHPGSFPLSAVIANALLDSLLCLSLFWLGRSLHSRRAGLIAATAHALWVPSLAMTGIIRQEQLFVPLLVTGLACLAWAIDRQEGRARWLLAGAVLGLAALARSSVAYFVFPGALLYVWIAPHRPTAWRQCAWWIGTFLLTVAPYSALVSADAGRLIPIEDIGAFNLRRGIGEASDTPLASYMKDPSRAPTGVDVARYLAGNIRHHPYAFVQSRVDYVRLLLKPLANVRGLVAATPGRALAAKWISHAITDVPFVIVMLLAPLGVVLARRRETALLLALWVVLYIVLVSLTLWAGSRWRLPIEPACVVLAAVVVAGGWTRPRRLALASSALGVVLVAILIASSVPGVLAARANYGVSSGPIGPAATELVVVGRAGVNVIVGGGTIVLTFRLDSSRAQKEPVRVVIRLSGREVDNLLIAGDQPRQVRYVAEPGVWFLELVALAADGSDATVAVSLPSVVHSRRVPAG
jgi:4-amino-4-deoxy-L-arabinose transferase-like glycosyltransferase